MKKYLITGLAAVAISGMFTSCTHDTDAGGSGYLGVVETYEQAFISRFGTPSPDADWGFGPSTTQAGTRTAYTNGNMWASQGWVVPTQLTDEQKSIVRQYFQQVKDPKYKDPKWKNYFMQHVYKGGTTVPNDCPTKEKYKSANNGWVVGSDHMDHLAAVAEDGTVDHINNYNNAKCSTYGNVGNTSGIKYYDVNKDGVSHPDQIQLMLNTTTYSFGYYNSEGSLRHTEYTGLVGWKTIYDWAKEKGIENYECLNDNWNRSYMGFDFEQIVGEDIYAKDNGAIRYAKYSETPGSPGYIWDGKNAYPRIYDKDYLNSFDMSNFWKSGESASWDKGIVNYNAVQWGGFKYWLGSADLSNYKSIIVEYAEAPTVKTQLVVQVKDKSDIKQDVEAGVTKLELSLEGKEGTNEVTQIALQAAEASTIKIKRIYAKAPDGSDNIIYKNKEVPYLTAETNEYCGTLVKLNDTDLKINQYVAAANSNQDCINLEKINQMLKDGYLPVSGSSMKDWVKVTGGADHYYSDWIVCLTEAKKTTDEEEEEEETSEDVVRVIAEDMGDQTTNESSDFDFNDVVFDVEYVSASEAKVTILAAGGTLPLTVGWNGDETNESGYIKYEVHNLLGYSETMIINTNSKVGNHIDNVEPKTITVSGSFDKDNLAVGANAIPVKVRKNNKWYTIVAPKGKAAGKLCVGTDYEWCDERQDIYDKWKDNNGALFLQYVNDPDRLTKYWYRESSNYKK
jgi:hypothetical protein